MFYFEKIDGKRILKSDFVKNAQAFFTTRDICICDKILEGNTPDENLKSEIENKIQNDKILIADYLKITPENLISPTQTHSANIETAKVGKHNYPDCDALILTDKNIAIFLNFADCTPVILYDEKQNIGAIAHAGWRGTVQKIAPKTAEKMMMYFGSKPENIAALIGPAIGFCCYNVGEEVFEKLSASVKNFDRLSEIRQGNIYVDLKNINKQQLFEIGVKKIDICPYCTVHNNNMFFSYRNENATTKRHSAILKLV